MVLAQPIAPTIGMLGLTFVSGFAVAALVFGLVRRNQRLNAAARTPKHALGNPPATATPATTPAAPPVAEKQRREEERPEEDDNPTQPDQLGMELTDIPALPTDLFHQRYEAKFERTRKRLERLRAQLNEQSG